MLESGHQNDRSGRDGIVEKLRRSIVCEMWITGELDEGKSKGAR